MLFADTTVPNRNQCLVPCVASLFLFYHAPSLHGSLQRHRCEPAFEDNRLYAKGKSHVSLTQCVATRTITIPVAIPPISMYQDLSPSTHGTKDGFFFKQKNNPK